MSLEQQPPKLLWLKRVWFFSTLGPKINNQPIAIDQNFPETFQRADRFFDLPDFLTFMATGNDSRSMCSVVCKWAYRAQETETKPSGWDATFWQSIGLEEFVKENYSRIGTRILHVGDSVGNGVSEKAAFQLGLLPGTPVGVSMIDAHAGTIGFCPFPFFFPFFLRVRKEKKRKRKNLFPCFFFFKLRYVGVKLGISYYKLNFYQSFELRVLIRSFLLLLLLSFF